ncbi:TIR domain-containing protein [Vibrio splendidus]|nr:TIR domain-containing protein [Vibrio splendidus]MCC4883177.1 TIR domain-containing protein [Vibrio splendidus]
MKIFISYNHQDKKYSELIASSLLDAGHDVFKDTLKLKAGDNIVEKIDQGVSEADVLIVLISKNALNSKWIMHEVSAMAMRDFSNKNKKIIPIKLDNSPMPSYLMNYLYLDFTEGPKSAIDKLVSSLSSGSKKEEFESVSDSKESNSEYYSTELAHILASGRLTLVCGAGVSVGAGVPIWDRLLFQLLSSMMRKISKDHSIPFSKIAVTDFQENYAPSSLIIGKYLKNNLGKDFIKEVRNALYVDHPTTCDVIDAIVNLSRPQRASKPLDSIITFNFDSLLEENLAKENVPHKAVHKEGMTHGPNELPIYHVHGYLPKKGTIPRDTEIVFSEDAYHSQFIEPFSWSNLIQLNKLNENTCLFIGLSLTDPNLRRLLDVANRKKGNSSPGHYIIKKSPSANESVDGVARILEEQDAKNLGLNLIWVENYDEIPAFLNGIAASTTEQTL